MNYYEHHIGDYDKSTSHLTACEDGIYSRLLRRYYDTESPLPVDLAAVQRLVRARTKEEKIAVHAMLVEFFSLADDGWHQIRCDKDIEKFRDKSAKAKRSAESRWNPQCERNANASKTHGKRNAHQTPDTNHQQEQKQHPARQAARFAEWWAVYPKKVGRKPAEQKWRTADLDPVADELIADVQQRTASDDGWLRGFIPDPLTYLNQERWNDDLRTAPVARAGPTAAPSKTLSAIQKLEGMKHGLADTRTDDRLPKTPLLGFGPNPGD